MADSDYNWTALTRLRCGAVVEEVMAATQMDGIGVIASWLLRRDGTWRVRAVDTELGDWITEFGPEEGVPPEPPANLLEEHALSGAYGAQDTLRAERDDARAQVAALREMLDSLSVDPSISFGLRLKITNMLDDRGRGEE
ncbi:MAG: hypothetical protein Q8R92_04195 [Deltaproteobacteria bacterium]|nr:hypothetical protein [Deltaproteobacteria bacterium]